MSEMALMILEVSQKQSYIFKSKLLKNNINASNIIAYVTSVNYLNSLNIGFNEEENLVYAGGGNTILKFKDKETAIEFSKKLSKSIIDNKDFKGIEVFIKVNGYDPTKTPGENVEQLIGDLETKKALRRASFHQGLFGIDKYSLDSKDTKVEDSNKYNNSKNESVEEIVVNNGYQLANEFEDLGITKNKSNFIAVVHIDGNQMGNKIKKKDEQINKAIASISDVKEKLNKYCEEKKKHSQTIDEVFTGAYLDMVQDVVNELNDKNSEVSKQLSLEDGFFPVRRLITEGDDIAFVCEGRIGLECAVSYMKHLQKNIDEDSKERFTACAGVAIVHSHYPFYKAYELAESLCGNAKKELVLKANDKTNPINACAIDWHIEYGEVYGDLADFRERNYTKVETKESVTARPYVVDGIDYKGVKDGETLNMYSQFVSTFELINNPKKLARSKVKGLRDVLKLSEEDIQNYKTRNLIDFDIKVNEVFDATEIMDTFIPFKGGNK